MMSAWPLLAPTFETDVDCIPLRSQKWNCLLDVLVTVAAVHVVVVTTLRCSRRYPHIPLLVLAPMCLHCVFDLEVLVEEEEARFEHVDDLIRTALQNVELVSLELVNEEVAEHLSGARGP